MPRTRELKPAFFQDEDLATLSRDHRLLFEALWTLADREGRLEDRPAFIKINFCPYDDDMPASRVDKMLDDLADHKKRFIVRYEADGKRCILVRNLKEHQHIHPKEAASVLPKPPANQKPSGELPGVTGKAESSREIMPFPSEPSIPSEPSESSRLSPETPEASSEPPVLVFPCDGQVDHWDLMQSQVDEWKRLFPSQDVEGEARKALAWVQAQPSKRKTAKGMPRFLVGWLGRNQDGGRVQQGALFNRVPSKDVRHGMVRSEDCKHQVTGEVKI